jgi:hypothetical protein
MTTTANETPALSTDPAVMHKPWCDTYGDGEPEHRSGDEVTCLGEILSVPATREPMTERVDRDRTIRYEGEYDGFDVWACQRLGEEPMVTVDQIGDSIGAHMTIDEAQQLIEALQLVIGQVTA